MTASTPFPVAWQILVTFPRKLEAFRWWCERGLSNPAPAACQKVWFVRPISCLFQAFTPLLIRLQSSSNPLVNCTLIVGRLVDGLLKEVPVIYREVHPLPSTTRPLVVSLVSTPNRRRKEQRMNCLQNGSDGIRDGSRQIEFEMPWVRPLHHYDTYGVSGSFRAPL